MDYTLVIWSEIPENTFFYLIPNEKITPKIREYLSQAHNKFINFDEAEPGMEFLNIAFCDPKHAEDYTIDYPDFAEYAGLFQEFKVAPENPITGKIITFVYHSGFGM